MEIVIPTLAVRLWGRTGTATTRLVFVVGGRALASFLWQSWLPYDKRPFEIRARDGGEERAAKKELDE